MKPKMSKTVRFNSLTVHVSKGSFSLDPDVREGWQSCREYFARWFQPDVKSIFIKHPEDKGKNIAELIWKIEEVLALQKNSEFAPTNYNTILCMKPSDFWKECEMRRSLLTAVMRAGFEYDGPDSFENTLFTARHLKGTKVALMRFLFGFTRYDGPALDTSPGTDHIITKGWYSVFNNVGIDKARKYMKWPIDTSPFNSSVQGTLWAA